MANRRIIVISALFLATFSCNLPFTQGEGGFSQEEAAQLVLDDVVQTATVDGAIIVFTLSQTLQSSDQLVAFNPPEYSPASQPMQIAGEAWFFWIDDAPGARFAHPSRFVVVDKATGDVTVSEEEWWPLLNGESLWVESEDYWNEDNWLFSTVDWRPANLEASRENNLLDPNITAFGKKAITSMQPFQQQARTGKALVISGEGHSDSQNKEFEVDASAMHELLTHAGFETFYLAPDNGFHPERDGTNDNESLEAVIKSFRESIKPGETFFVYITGHGFESKELGENYAGGVWESDLQEWLSHPIFLNGVETIPIIDACYSGGFVDSTADYADMTITATDATTAAYFDRDDDNDPNPDDVGGEFSSGFVEDWKEILADPDEVLRVGTKATDRDISFWQALAGESYISAAEKDAGLLNGKSFPLLTPGLPSATGKAVPTAVHLDDPLDDGLMCPNGDTLSGTTPERIDIGEVIVEWVEHNVLGFTIVFPRVDVLQPIVGSVEFDYPSIQNSKPSATWYFSGRGEFDANFEFDPSTGVSTEAYNYTGESWELVPNSLIEGHHDGNTITIKIPMDDYPEIEHGFRYWVGAVMPDFQECDAAGLDENGQATGEIP